MSVAPSLVSLKRSKHAQNKHEEIDEDMSLRAALAIALEMRLRHLNWARTDDMRIQRDSVHCDVIVPVRKTRLSGLFMGVHTYLQEFFSQFQALGALSRRLVFVPNEAIPVDKTVGETASVPIDMEKVQIVTTHPPFFGRIAVPSKSPLARVYISDSQEGSHDDPFVPNEGRARRTLSKVLPATAKATRSVESAAARYFFPFVHNLMFLSLEYPHVIQRDSTALYLVAVNPVTPAHVVALAPNAVLKYATEYRDSSAGAAIRSVPLPFPLSVTFVSNGATLVHRTRVVVLLPSVACGDCINSGTAPMSTPRMPVLPQDTDAPVADSSLVWMRLVSANEVCDQHGSICQ
ncbi:MAG: hypothetical protein MHM6MM_002536 [Cercozoa sp. M6MM]